MKTVHFTVRAAEAALARIDQLVVIYNNKMDPGAPEYTRAGVARIAMERGIEALELIEAKRTAKRSK